MPFHRSQNIHPRYKSTRHPRLYSTVIDVNGELQVNVEWEGLPDKEDWTSEPLSQICSDLPGRVEDFLNTSGSRELKRRGLAQCNFS